MSAAQTPFGQGYATSLARLPRFIVQLWSFGRRCILSPVCFDSIEATIFESSQPRVQLGIFRLGSTDSLEMDRAPLVYLPYNRRPRRIFALSCCCKAGY